VRSWDTDLSARSAAPARRASLSVRALGHADPVRELTHCALSRCASGRTRASRRVPGGQRRRRGDRRFDRPSL